MGCSLLLDLCAGRTHGCLVLFIGMRISCDTAIFNSEDSSFLLLKALRSIVWLLIWIVFLVQVLVVGSWLLLPKDYSRTLSIWCVLFLPKDRHKWGHESWLFFHFVLNRLNLLMAHVGRSISMRCVSWVERDIVIVLTIECRFGCCRLFFTHTHEQILHVNLVDLRRLLLFLNFFIVISQKTRLWLLCHSWLGL